MKEVSQLSEYQFPSPEMAIASLRVPLDQIAERSGLTVETWEEHGLGRARGMFVQFSSGRVALLRELEHAIKHLGQEGPTIYVDAVAVASGVERLVAEILEGLGLPNSAVADIAPSDSRDVAAQLLTAMTRRDG